MTVSADCRSLDPHIWRCCAGTTGEIPADGSLVYYFPHGHSEQSSAPLSPSSLPITKPYSLCRVLSVSLLANPDSDEAFAKIRLCPVSAAADPDPDEVIDAKDSGDLDEVMSFAKILTPSDANNGGGFSVPRTCADSIFPELDFKADPPVQTLSVKDVQGNTWDFRHIYRGTPRRHLLTTGWSRFVNSKKLIAGDSVIFIKKKCRGGGGYELFVGIRRTGRSLGTANLEYVKLEENVESGFSRNVKGRVPAKLILEAARLMEAGRPFEVMFYPRVGLPEFVIKKEVVERAMSVYWTAGMRVKMSEDLSRTTLFQGMVTSVVETKDLSAGRLQHSPWRMLQITWDEPEVLQNVRTVNPWQVELVSASPHPESPFPDMKKLRVSNILDLSSEGQGSLASSFFNYNIFPVGIQGARHDTVSSLSNFIPTNHQFFEENSYGINMFQELNVSYSEGTSSPSQETIHQNSLDLFGPSACNPTTNCNKGYFQLFGQIIPIYQPDEDGDSDSVGDEACSL